MCNPESVRGFVTGLPPWAAWRRSIGSRWAFWSSRHCRRSGLIAGSRGSGRRTSCSSTAALQPGFPLTGVAGTDVRTDCPARSTHRCRGAAGPLTPALAARPSLRLADPARALRSRTRPSQWDSRPDAPAPSSPRRARLCGPGRTTSAPPRASDHSCRPAFRTRTASVGGAAASAARRRG